MSLIKALFQLEKKFSPASEVNWTKIETLVHGPGAGAQNDGMNSAVFACLTAISFAYPEPPLTVYRKDSAGKSERMADSPLQFLLDNPTPNGELSIEEIRFWTAWAKHVDGNAYWLKVRSGNAETGNVIQLWPISPTLIKPVTEQDSGDWISFYEYQYAPGKFQHIPVNNVIHFRLGLDDRDMRKGLAPLKALVRQITTDEEADKFVDALLKNYAVPGLVVTPIAPATIDETTADLMTDKMRRKYGNNNRGNIAVMSKSVDVKQFGFSPEDMNLTVLHRIPEERISAVIGVPAIVAGLGAGLDRATYANFKEAREMFTESKLVPQWRADGVKLTTSLCKDFDSDKRIYIAHDLTDVRAFQEDEDSKYKRLQIAVGKPWATRNEARTDTGLDPVEGWDDVDLEAAPPEPVVVTQPVNEQPPADQAQNAKAIDLDKWERKANKALKAGGNANVEFTSEFIPLDLATAIHGKLATAKTDEDVHKAFIQDVERDPLLILADELRLARLAAEAG